MEKESAKSLILSSIPNLLTISRIIFTFIVIYSIFVGMHIVTTIVLFSIAALTDLFDGRLARKFKWESEFGRKADMIADRFLWMGTALAFTIVFGRNSELEWYHGIQLLLITMREIISTPFALAAFFSGNALPKARHIGKATTLLQGFALPTLILSTLYSYFIFISIPFSLATGIVGFFSAMYYIKDVKPKEKRK